MKRAALLFLLVIITISIGVAQENGSKSDKKDTKPEIKFEKTIHDFGKIKYNGDGTCSFKFENIGKKPLLLKDVSGNCGSIIDSWPKEPIKSGETGTIKVVCNTRVVGNFSVTIRVYSNAKNYFISLLVKGQVEMKD